MTGTDIIVISGLPRSGTSLMMQMMAAAGVTLQTDGARAPDASNPRGYFEWERIKQLPREPGSIGEARGKAVKVISSLLPLLPREFDYRIVFMERDIDEVAASQRQMIAQSGARRPDPLPEQIRRALELHRKQVDAWMAWRGDLKVLRVPYAGLLENPTETSTRVARFLELSSDRVAAMASAVDPNLRRHRTSSWEI